jgi:hypothetical protein
VIRLPISSGQITIVDLNDTIVSSTQPSNPIDGTLWLDTSVTPNVLKVYRTGVGWVKATPTTPEEVGAVSPSGIIAAINASGEQVKIQGTKIDITGQVTYNSLSSGLQQSFNADGTVKTSRLSGTISDSQIASASTWNTIKDRVNSWTISSTKINGGLIETNTIVASALVLSDFTNLCENPDFESDTVGSNPRGYTTNSLCRVADISGFTNGNGSNRALEIDAKNGSNNDIYTSNIFPVRPNQQFYVEAEARYLNTAGTGWLRIGFRRYDDKKQPLSSWVEVVKWDGTKTTTFTKKSGTFTVPSGTGYLQIWISFLNNGETTNKAYIDNIRVHRMAGGELIVDGTIEAKHIKSLNGLNINDKFIVDGSGNVTFAGTLNGASGTFTGKVEVIHTPAGNLTEKVTIDMGIVNASLDYVGAGFNINRSVLLSNGAISLKYSDENYMLDGEAIATIWNNEGTLSIENDYDIELLPYGGSTSILSPTYIRGLLTVDRHGESLQLQTMTTGTSALTYMTFYSDTTRLGYVGVGSTNNNDLYVYSDSNSVRLVSGNNIIQLGTGSTAYINYTGGYPRLQYDAGTYVMVGANYVGFYGEANYLARFVNRDSGHSALVMQKASLKGLASSSTLQVRNDYDTAYATIQASAFQVASEREYKKNIESYEDDALKLVIQTPVYKYHYTNEDDLQPKHIGLIVDEAPYNIVGFSSDTIDTYAMTSLLWKAVQQLAKKVDELENEIILMGGNV